MNGKTCTGGVALLSRSARKERLRLAAREKLAAFTRPGGLQHAPALEGALDKLAALEDS